MLLEKMHLPDVVLTMSIVERHFDSMPVQRLTR